MPALEHARDLIAIPTVSHQSNESICGHLEAVLRSLGFAVERVEYRDPSGTPKVNLVAKKGDGVGGMAYFAHTDVVPAGGWTGRTGGPFDPEVDDGRLYGRGSCDMKGSIAAMLAATEEALHGELREPLYIVLTADEEVGYLGAKEVVRRSDLYREIAAGQSRTVVGEPTSLEVVHAHKGTYGFRAVARGRAAHSSTDEGINANLAMIPFLAEMKDIHDETLADPAWQHAAFDPPGISWNIGINDHTKAVNVTAAQSVCTVYFRPAPGHDADALLARAGAAAQRRGLEFEVLESGSPLYADPESAFVREVLELAGQAAPRTVCYGTDGAVLSDLERVVVLGPGDIAQAHTSDEWILLDQLKRGTALYAQLIRQWCG